MIEINTADAHTLAVSVLQRLNRARRIRTTFESIDDPALAVEWLDDKGWDLDQLDGQIENLDRVHKTICAKLDRTYI